MTDKKTTRDLGWLEQHHKTMLAYELLREHKDAIVSNKGQLKRSDNGAESAWSLHYGDVELRYVYHEAHTGYWATFADMVRAEKHMKSLRSAINKARKEYA